MDNAIEVSPNPAQYALNVAVSLQSIDSDHPIEVSIVSAQGDVMYEGTQTTSKFQIDVSAFPFGNYFLNVTQGDINLSKQFLKN